MKKVWISFLAGVLLFCLPASCAGPPAKQHIRDGKEYGLVRGAFRHRWWNYYERGLSFMEGEFYREALSDMEKALKQRYEDKRMARTYGMHFVDYFPHREKGLIYYLSGDYDAARKEFEISINLEPTAKAQFYLDKIRKIILEHEKPAISIPQLLVNLPSDEMWTRDDPVIISGTAEDKQYISKISLAESGVFLEAAQKHVSFSEKFRLDQGRHEVKIVAENLLGGRAIRELIIHVDRQGPVISLEPPSPKSAMQGRINGYLYDESGKIFLSIDGVPVHLPDGEDVSFTAPLRPGAKHVVLLAKDSLGNETKAEVNMEDISARKRYPLLAALDFGKTMSDAGGIKLAFSFGKKDIRKPSVKLPGWSEEQTVFLKKAYVEGEVRDENNIVDLTVNDTPVLRRKGRIIFFNHLVDLKEGENIIKVMARDKAGNTAVKKISIIREIPKVLQIGSRFSMSLLPFENKGTDTGLNFMFENLFSTRLMDQNRFRLIEREKLDKILQEQNLSRTKLIDRKTAIEVGRLVAASSTLIGNFIETRIGIEAVARLVDNETSEILAIKDVYDEFKDRAALMSMAEGMAIKFHREFPLVDGMIVRTKGKSFYADLGKGKTKPNRRLIIYREGESIRHPETGKILGSDTKIVGYARVTQVMDQMSKAVLIKGLKGEDIRMQDKVMTE